MKPRTLIQIAALAVLADCCLRLLAWYERKTTRKYEMGTRWTR